ncbi:MAG: hypothetical protein ISS48_02885 [Candidatus Aenigmarchaeota archaeon]|nr:hypothetical protein [Candidatus Aenigmarchaeota archaeon]
MRKAKEFKLLQKVIPIFFLLIFVEIAILGLKKGVSLLSLLEVSSGLLLIIIYYFLIRLEFKLASKELEESLKVLINRFDRIEDDLKEELKILASEISELKKILKKK